MAGSRLLRLGKWVSAMFDFQSDAFEYDDLTFVDDVSAMRDAPYRPPLWKFLFDQTIALTLLPLLTLVAGALVLLNPFLNRGPLFFKQERMGHRCRPFTALKFRTMTAGKSDVRGAFDALEVDRITSLGRLMRKMRIDELPQIINVLRGQMSLIGPRPDSYEHAKIYLHRVPGYAARHRVMPGISGYAQTEVGYVDGLEGLHRKVAADAHYIANATFRLDLWITWRTLVVVFGRGGA